MSATTTTSRQRLKLVVWLAAGLAFMGVAGANAHLVYVAFQSQPDCVAHLKTAGGDGGYRAAKSAC